MKCDSLSQPLNSDFLTTQKKCDFILNIQVEENIFELSVLGQYLQKLKGCDILLLGKGEKTELARRA